MKWLLMCMVFVSMAGLAGCEKSTAGQAGQTCQRRSDCADGLTCAHDLTCQTYAKAKEMQLAAEKN
ncbi:MAG: hypothetical protein ACOYOB_04570 [Myxococcota bacterium]